MTGVSKIWAHASELDIAMGCVDFIVMSLIHFKIHSIMELITLSIFLNDFVVC